MKARHIRNLRKVVSKFEEYIVIPCAGLFRILFQGCDMGWFKDTLKKL